MAFACMIAVLAMSAAMTETRLDQKILPHGAAYDRTRARLAQVIGAYKVLSKSGHTKINLFVPSPIIELLKFRRLPDREQEQGAPSREFITERFFRPRS